MENKINKQNEVSVKEFNEQNERLVKNLDVAIINYMKFLAQDGASGADIAEQLTIILTDNLRGFAIDDNLILKEEKVNEISQKVSDGHYTLMKFTTNWRFMFGTIDDLSKVRDQINNMICADTKEELLDKVIEMYLNDEIRLLK